MFRALLICILLLVSLASVRSQGAKKSNPKPSDGNSNQNQNKPGPKNSPSVSPRPSNEATPGASPSRRTDREKLQLQVGTALAQAKAANDPFNTANYEELLRLEKRVEEFKRTIERSDASDRELQAEANSLISDAGQLRDASKPSWVSTFLGTTLFGLMARVAALIGIVLLSVTVTLLLRMQKRFAGLHFKLDQVAGAMTAAVSNELREVSSSRKSLEEALAGRIDKLSEEFTGVRTNLAPVLDHIKTGQEKNHQQQNGFASGEELIDAVYAVPENLSLAELLNSSEENQKIPVSFQIANSVFVRDDAGKLIVITNNHDSNFAILIPKATQLNSVDQFTNHLEVAYVCRNVTVGPIFIVKPTTVKRNADGWEIETQGTIEIRGA
jgi:hypothetical protein